MSCISYLNLHMHSAELHALTSEERLQLQAHLRGMYVEIEKVCDRHGLRMCAGYGTVLGALRHGGFIPWDDDMDLLMPRDDYDKFVNLYAGELPRHLKVYAPNSKNGPIARFAKVVDIDTRFTATDDSDDDRNGIFIDIFPIENTISNMTVIRAKRLCAMFLMVVASSVAQYASRREEHLYRRLMCSTLSGKRTYQLRSFIGWAFSFLYVAQWYNILDRWLQHGRPTPVCSVPSGDAARWKYFTPYPWNLYFPVRRVRFDDIEIYIPHQAEHHCEIEYGDWNRIPPEEDRWQHFVKTLKFKL